MDGKFIATGKYSLVLSLIIISYSCTNHSNDNTFKILDEGFERSNIVIERSTQLFSHSLESKLSDPITSYKAGVWYPKVQIIRELSKEIASYLEKLKTEIKNRKGLPDEKAIELYGRLLKYKDDVLNVDSSLKIEFKTRTVITEEAFDSVKHNANDFRSYFFKDISAQATFSMLNKFRNNIEIIQNRMIQFCSYKVPDPDNFYEAYSVMAVQSSSYVKAGDLIEVIAGVGTFSLKAKATIIIDGNSVQPGSDGVALYKFKASKNWGKHHIPVEVEFTDQDGKRQTIIKELDYTVMK